MHRRLFSALNCRTFRHARLRLDTTPRHRFTASARRLQSNDPDEPGTVTASIVPFDTLKFVERLESDGLTRQQSEAAMTALSEVIDDSIGALRTTMIAKSEQDRTIHAYRVDFARLKSEIHLLEKNDFAILKQENERVAAEVDKLKQRIREDLQHLQSGVRLDMNLDKARVRDEQGLLQLKIKETEARLEQEVNKLRADIENVRWDTIKTMGAAATSIGVLILGLVRYFKS